MTGTGLALERAALGILRWSVRNHTRGSETGKAVAAWFALKWVNGMPFVGAWTRVRFDMPPVEEQTDRSTRILRARLALAIRAMLRAERGDMGEYAILDRRQYDGPWARYEHLDRMRTALVFVAEKNAHPASALTGFTFRARLARPLWCDAPPARST